METNLMEIQKLFPTIEIQSHGDGTEFDEGYEVQFYAQAFRSQS